MSVVYQDQRVDYLARNKIVAGLEPGLDTYRNPARLLHVYVHAVRSTEYGALYVRGTEKASMNPWLAVCSKQSTYITPEYKQ